MNCIVTAKGRGRYFLPRPFHPANSCYFCPEVEVAAGTAAAGLAVSLDLSPEDVDDSVLELSPLLSLPLDFSDSLVFSEPLEFDLSLVSADSEVSGLRESLMYQPEPLKTIPTGYNRRLTGPVQTGQIAIGSSFIA